MKILNNIPDKDLFKEPIITIGNFDGVHIGHKKILSMLCNKARQKSGDSLVLTFSSHPRKILNPDNPPKIITTADEKIEVISHFGIDYMILMDFTREMSNMNAMEFYNEFFIKRIGVKEIVIGYDHAFGKDREGNIDFLTELSASTGIGITRVPGENIDSKPVSSTWLRREIEKGNILTATALLGRRYSIRGKVVRGAGRGKGLGFPTANIVPDNPDKIIPADGVYAAAVLLDNSIKKNGMLNIGKNPTFSATGRSIEVNIFDFDDDIYDSEITIEFYDRIRNEIKFDSVELLVNQIKQDRISVAGLFKNQNG